MVVVEKKPREKEPVVTPQYIITSRKEVADDLEIEVIDKVPRWRYLDVEKFLGRCREIYDHEKKPVRFSAEGFVRKFATKGETLSSAVNVIENIGEAMGYPAIKVLSNTYYIYVEF